MEHTIGYAITLRPRIKADEFEAFFQKCVRDARKKSQLLTETEFVLYRPVRARKEYVWITSFPTTEFERVTRAAIPFIVLVILDVLRELRQ